MEKRYWLNIGGIPVLSDNVPDYRAEAIEMARKYANVFGIAYVLYNGLYYHVTSSEGGRIQWQKKGYDVIHVERYRRENNV